VRTEVRVRRVVKRASCGQRGVACSQRTPTELREGVRVRAWRMAAQVEEADVRCPVHRRCGCGGSEAVSNSVSMCRHRNPPP
jgi:hypothetical protein